MPSKEEFYIMYNLQLTLPISNCSFLQDFILGEGRNPPKLGGIIELSMELHVYAKLQGGPPLYENENLVVGNLGEHTQNLYTLTKLYHVHN